MTTSWQDSTTVWRLCYLWHVRLIHTTTWQIERHDVVNVWIATCQIATTWKWSGQGVEDVRNLDWGFVYKHGLATTWRWADDGFDWWPWGWLLTWLTFGQLLVLEGTLRVYLVWIDKRCYHYSSVVDVVRCGFIYKVSSFTILVGRRHECQPTRLCL